MTLPICGFDYQTNIGSATSTGVEFEIKGKPSANLVLGLSGSPHDSIAASKGRAKFAVCAACHGADGKGNQALGAPNLTDAIWLHGWGEEAIVAMVTSGKTNVMPAHRSRLTPQQIHVLAAYVWGLSNQAPVAP